MKRCKYAELVMLYFDKELTNEENITFVEKHLSSCKTCKEWYDYLKKLDASLRSSSSEVLTPPPNLLVHTLEKIDRYESVRLEKPSFLKWWPYLLIPAAVSIICIVAYTILTSPKEIIVKFELRESDLPYTITKVAVVGDFNNWEMENLKFVTRERKWSLKKRIKPGRYHYMFVINGTIWLPDPNAEGYVEDGYGNKNSILDSNIM